MAPAIKEAEKRRVYLATRAIFTGEKAMLRRQSKIRNEITKRSVAMASLTKDMGLQKVLDISRELLEKRIFESNLKAKVEFPELFQSSLEQDAFREGSELDAARSMSEVLENIAETDGEGENAGVDMVEGDLQEAVESAPIQEILESRAGGKSSSFYLFVAVGNILKYPRRVAPSCISAALTFTFTLSVVHSIQDTAPHSQRDSADTGRKLFRVCSEVAAVDHRRRGLRLCQRHRIDQMDAFARQKLPQIPQTGC